MNMNMYVSFHFTAAIIKGNHTNCAQFANINRLNWLFSRLGSQASGEGSGMLDVLHCVLIDSPEALNMMREEHIKVIISLLEKHGRDPKVLDVLCSLCVGNGVAVRSSQNNISDYLLPGKNLLLQTQLVDHVGRLVNHVSKSRLILLRGSFFLNQSQFFQKHFNFHLPTAYDPTYL